MPGRTIRLGRDVGGAEVWVYWFTAADRWIGEQRCTVTDTEQGIYELPVPPAGAARGHVELRWRDGTEFVGAVNV